MLLPAVLEGASRWVAIGDLHGSLEATRTALRLAGAIDGSDRWIGGDLVVVQVGDQLDRGDEEQAVLELLERLASEALAAGGALLPLLGNHETMNIDEDFRYVTAGGWLDFAHVPHDPDDPRLQGYAPEERGRVAAFLPGGPFATILSGHPVADGLAIPRAASRQPFLPTLLSKLTRVPSRPWDSAGAGQSTRHQGTPRTPSSSQDVSSPS